MQHLDEGTIHAWLDGELPSVEREAAEAHIAQCEQCAAAVAEARGFIAASSRILMALDAVPGGVLPAAQGSSAPAGKRTPARFTVSRAWMAAAAVLILSTATAIVVRPRSDKGVATLAQRDEMRAPRVDSPVSTSAAAPAIAPEERKSANAVALKAPAPNAAARGVTAPNAPASNALAPRRAALAEKADSSTFSDRKPSALALLPVAPAGQAADAMVAKAESPAAPAASRMEAQSGAAGVGGNIRARPQLPQSLIASEQNAPQVVSRSTTTENGDTVVTTVYSVNGVPVSLIDESTSRSLRQPEAKVGVADQPMAMARDTALEAHSITWSDSTGRTRTLRGAMSQAELERVKRALFGPTP